MDLSKEVYDELEQYDYTNDEYLNKVAFKYYPLIGSFLIAFSKLENQLNIVIADFIHDGGHETGFVVIEKVTTNNKIDLFYKLYLRFVIFKLKPQKYKENLVKIRKSLESLNLFRNGIVHANWESLDNNGFVRTKIVVDGQEGYVKFKKIEVLPKLIRQRINEANRLINKLFEFGESSKNP